MPSTVPPLIVTAVGEAPVTIMPYVVPLTIPPETVTPLLALE